MVAFTKSYKCNTYYKWSLPPSWGAWIEIFWRIVDTLDIVHAAPLRGESGLKLTWWNMINYINEAFMSGFKYALQLQKVCDIYKARLLYPTLKKDEEVVCLNALVVMNSRGDISYYNKDHLPLIYPTNME